ncbi:hypothetical protein SYNTR_0955 [Candidatus Syntrophocurvum alkaliphilum]|uniref:Uncharacterized protein n=1 Tax=Candidatus Syntrophocurvum alkaliphilum TaxID=2293317 RepID=A0A6I6D9I6_9FIRM|nr:hypothetical protein SYNTR_0955 [Candidatus Syntrophocurvum alkaliphilum]
MWFLNQSDCLEVLEYKEFRQEIKETVEGTNNIYDCIFKNYYLIP